MTSTLSGSRKPSQIVHASTRVYHTRITRHDTACGTVGEVVLTEGPGMPVTCKRCLASLAKRDQEFRAKARRGITEFSWRARNRVCGPAVEAARAIAREEGRP